jgi:demethylsterigmatocystin 6-O-methyltransferase
MADDSVILIDEMVLPDVGVPRFATCVDLTMMASFSARERTLKQWTVLLDKAGLKVNDLNRYGGATGNSVLEVIRA